MKVKILPAQLALMHEGVKLRENIGNISGKVNTL